jgi:hypothetical protein
LESEWLLEFVVVVVAVESVVVLLTPFKRVASALSTALGPSTKGCLVAEWCVLEEGGLPKTNSSREEEKIAWRHRRASISRRSLRRTST